MNDAAPATRPRAVPNAVTADRSNLLLTLLLAALLLAGFVLSALNLGSGTFAWSMLRATGMVAYLALALSVVFGALLGSRYSPAWLARVQQYGWHSLLSGFALVLGTVHGLVLTVDGAHAQPLVKIVAPWTGGGAPLEMVFGTLGLYGLALVYLSTLWRRHLSQRVWRAVHLASYPAFVLLTLHSVMAGSDALGPLYGAAVAACVLTFGLRFLEETGKRGRRAQGA
jgi:methionine sulfoxide reductase heme-binding subunit